MDAMSDGAGIRSLLFVPGDNEKLISKALASEADAVILDLEDAVAPDAKPRARQIVSETLEQAGRNGKPVFVRINALDSGLAPADLAAVVRGSPWGIMLPKCNGQADLLQLAFYLDALEARDGVTPGSTRILAIVTETASATLNLSQTPAVAPPRLWGTMWGSEDLAASLGATANRDEAGIYTFPYQSARSQCLYSAHGMGVAAVDAVWTDFRDLAGLERETREALRDGFTAKAAIHPAQIEAINRVLSPSADQVDWAGQVVGLLTDKGVARLDGKMVDLAHKRVAERILKRHAAIAGASAA